MPKKRPQGSEFPIAFVIISDCDGKPKLRNVLGRKSVSFGGCHRDLPGSEVASGRDEVFSKQVLYSKFRPWKRSNDWNSTLFIIIIIIYCSIVDLAKPKTYVATNGRGKAPLVSKMHAPLAPKWLRRPWSNGNGWLVVLAPCCHYWFKDDIGLLDRRDPSCQELKAVAFLLQLLLQLAEIREARQVASRALKRFRPSSLLFGKEQSLEHGHQGVLRYFR